MQVEEIGKNKVKLTFNVGPERFEEGLVFSYNKNKSKINIPGFRKGKTPRKVIEANYGKSFLYEDAINFVLGEAYESAIDEKNIDVVGRPIIDVESVSSEVGVVFTAEVATKPAVKVSNYKGLTYKKFDPTVTDEEINQKLEAERVKNARTTPVTDRAVQDGDTVNIEYTGRIDGVMFDGGYAEDHELTIGSKSFIPGFEDQIIGHNVDETFDIDLTFPAIYHSEELAGKDVVFTITIFSISTKELPEVNDEFASDISEFDTLDELKASITKEISEKKAKNFEIQKENEIIENLIKISEIDDASVMIDEKLDDIMRNIVQNIARQGIDKDMYFSLIGQTEDEVRAGQRATAEKFVHSTLVLEAVAKAENIEVTEAEVLAEYEEIAKKYNMPVEQVKLALESVKSDTKMLKNELLVKKTVEQLISWAVEA